MAALTTQNVPVTGLTPSTTAAGGSGDTIAAGENTFLLVKNGSGSSITVTVAVPGTEYGQARPDVGVAVAAGAEALIHIPAEIDDPSDHRIHVSYSATTTVTVAALRLV
jgi:hypothetical protein